MKQGFAFVEKRFEDMNKKFELLFRFVGLVFVVTDALIIIFKFLRVSSYV